MEKSLNGILNLLENQYGKPGTLPVSGPFAMILWENIAYLVDDQRRRSTFEDLKRNVGLSADKILEASRNELRKALASGGIILEQRLEKLSNIGKIVTKEFGGDVNQILDWPPEKAKKALQLFPGIGEPVAEKILLFCRRLQVLALDSNGLRALLRLGFGREGKNYRATYRSVQQAATPYIMMDYDWLIRAYHLLRIHGQQICKRNRPHCSECPLLKTCDFAAAYPLYGKKGS